MTPINLPTLVVVQGATLTRTLQCKDLDGTLPTQLLNTDTLAGSVFIAQGEPALISFTPTWVSAPAGTVQISLTAAQTASLTVDTTYQVQVTATRSGIPYTIAWLWLYVAPAPGSQATPTPPDLVAYPVFSQLAGSLNLTQAQVEQVPTLISAASMAVRSYCNRLFTQQVIVETVPVQLDGTIRLSQVPVSYVQRIQAIPDQALFVGNSLATLSWIYATVSGVPLVYANQTMTGLVLNWEDSGGTHQQTITFSAGMTISQLAAAINAIGSGWAADAYQWYQDLPVTEILDGVASKGAGPNDQPDGGATYHVYSMNVPNARPCDDDGQLTGLFYVGRIRSGENLRWGPEAGYWESQDRMTGKVKVTYQGGFQTVPVEIQLAVVELVKAQLDRLKTEMLLASESAGDYSYSVNTEQAVTIPPNVRKALDRWRIYNT